MSTFHRGDVLLVQLDPTRGSEIRKTRPCVVVSPDEMNEHLNTLVVAPMTTKGRSYPFRVSASFEGKSGFIVLDQLRTVDRERVARSIGRMSGHVIADVLAALQEMFSP